MAAKGVAAGDWGFGHLAAALTRRFLRLRAGRRRAPEAAPPVPAPRAPLPPWAARTAFDLRPVRVPPYVGTGPGSHRSPS